MKIIQFQEALGVDISQVAYPPAHESETENLVRIASAVREREYKIRIAGLCRSMLEDAKRMVGSGVTDFHLHTAVTQEMLKRQDIGIIFDALKQTVALIRSEVETACINVSILDIGKTEIGILEKCADFLINNLKIDILCLPDTSGIMAPNRLHERILHISRLAANSTTRIGVHCHNDLGMASANTIMGVLAGASFIDVTVLGIGERNGIGDIFIVGKILKDQGYDLNLKTGQIELFQKYYEYVNKLCEKKTGLSVLNYNTPFFGEAIKTHVAGTHGIAEFGVMSEKKYYLNVLCGKHLVRQYLDMHAITCDEKYLKEIVAKIKEKSVQTGRCVTKKEVADMTGRFYGV